MSLTAGHWASGPGQVVIDKGTASGRAATTWATRSAWPLAVPRGSTRSPASRATAPRTRSAARRSPSSTSRPPRRCWASAEQYDTIFAAARDGVSSEQLVARPAARWCRRPRRSRPASSRPTADSKDDPGQQQVRPVLPARVRVHRARRGRVRDLQHALDHARPAHPRARDPAHARRVPAPDQALGADRGPRHGRVRLRPGPRARAGAREGPERALRAVRRSTCRQASTVVSARTIMVGARPGHRGSPWSRASRPPGARRGSRRSPPCARAPPCRRGSARAGRPSRSRSSSSRPCCAWRARWAWARLGVSLILVGIGADRALPRRDHDRRSPRSVRWRGSSAARAPLRRPVRPAGQRQLDAQHDADGDHRRRAHDRARARHARRHLASGFRASTEAPTRTHVSADYVVTSKSGFDTIPADVGAAVARASGVRSVSAVRQDQAKAFGDDVGRQRHRPELRGQRRAGLRARARTPSSRASAAPARSSRSRSRTTTTCGSAARVKLTTSAGRPVAVRVAAIAEPKAQLTGRRC